MPALKYMRAFIFFPGCENKEGGFMKYFVIATRQNDDETECVKEIVGEFMDFNTASLFQNAYNNFYKADATVRSEEYLLKYGA